MKLTRPGLLLTGAWIAGLTTIVSLTGWALGEAAEQLIEKSAEHTAVRYAQTISAYLPELPQLLARQPVTQQTVDELARLQSLGDVFRFKLFDRNGGLVLMSDHLDQPDPLKASAEARDNLGAHHQPTDDPAAQVLNGRNHTSLKDGSRLPNRPPLYTEAYVPVLAGGEVLGVVEVYVDSTAHATRIRDAFAKVSLILGGALLLVGAAFLAQWQQRRRERRQAESRVRYLAKHDVLSGALNRASFNDSLEKAARLHAKGGPGFAVLCIDLDHFKEVNDAHGHAAGDAVLRETTSRLQALVRQGDLLARLGGDEFAILQRDVTQAEHVQKLGQRIVDALAQPYSLGSQQVVCGSSVGAARFGVDALTVEELLNKADVAMYSAKAGGRSRFSPYDHELSRQVEERRELARELRDALANGSLDMHYQAVHAADAKTLLGYEALMRWNHPSRGMVPPSTFIPLAEKTGQIEALGQWALERACADAARWPAPLTVSVNLSVAQFRGEQDLVDVVTRALDESGLDASRLVLEITESLLMSDTEAVVDTLLCLSSLGAGIAMDDFGTGYSSLAYLWKFPFDKVKIDRAFTQGLGEDEKVALIVSSIISLSHSLGIRVNAEGVETPKQAQMLRNMGCDELQGFLLGRPLPVSRLVHAPAAESGRAAPTAAAPGPAARATEATLP